MFFLLQMQDGLSVESCSDFGKSRPDGQRLFAGIAVIISTLGKPLSTALFVVAAMLASGCGGGGGGAGGFMPFPHQGTGLPTPPTEGGGVPTDPGNPSNPGTPGDPGPPGNPDPGSPGLTYSIGGAVTGLLSPLKLQLNGVETVVVATDGIFKFPTPLAEGAAYSVKVSAAPLWQQCAVAGESGAASTDVSTVIVTCTPPLAVVSKLAGADDRTPGAVDGKGSLARFNEPAGVALNAAGSLAISDAGNASIRMLGTDGSVSTFPLHGEAMVEQGHLVINRYGEMFVAGNWGRRVYKIFSDGRTLGLGPFSNATGVAMNTAGDLFVADAATFEITKHGSTGGVKKLTLDASIGSPYGIAVDEAGTLYVTDQQRHRVLKIEDESRVTLLAGSTRGHADGIGAAAKFNFPQGITVGQGGIVYVTDAHTVRAIYPGGNVVTLAGKGESSGAVDGAGSNARFFDPSAIALGPAGELYVTDRLNNSVRKLVSP